MSSSLDLWKFTEEELEMIDSLLAVFSSFLKYRVSFSPSVAFLLVIFLHYFQRKDILYLIPSSLGMRKDLKMCLILSGSICIFLFAFTKQQLVWRGGAANQLTSCREHMCE